MKTAILLEDGFECTEALSTRDILLRSRKIETLLVSASDSDFATSSDNLTVKTDIKFKDVDFSSVDFLILPGGKKGVENLKANKNVINLIVDFKSKGKPVYAICAAPSILGELGYLDDVSYTCYPGFQTAKGYTGIGVCVDKGQITGKAMAFSIDFGLAIIAKHLGEDVARNVLSKARGD